MNMEMFHWSDILLCEGSIFWMFTMITWNNSSSIRERFSPMTYMWPLMQVSWNEWRIITCETKHESIIPKWSRSTSGMNRVVEVNLKFFFFISKKHSISLGINQYLSFRQVSHHFSFGALLFGCNLLQDKLIISYWIPNLLYSLNLVGLTRK